MVWHPSPEETFVFVHPGTGKRFVMLIPGGEAPPSVRFETEQGSMLFHQDDDVTDKTRMFVSVDNRKRELAD
jgi:hypothetical protein